MAAASDTGKPEKSGPSMAVQLGALGVATAIAIGVGIFSGNYLGHTAASTASAPDNASTHTPAPMAAPVATALVTPLEAIITNLTDPADTLIRLELSAISAQALPVDLLGTVHQDLLAFIRTLRLHQISGASGFQHMRSELRERVRTRSSGAIDDVLIRVFILE